MDTPRERDEMEQQQARRDEERTLDRATDERDARRRLQFNPDPLKVTSTPRCVGCRRHTPGCTCVAPDYRWADGSKA